MCIFATSLATAKESENTDLHFKSKFDTYYIINLFSLKTFRTYLGKIKYLNRIIL